MKTPIVRLGQFGFIDRLTSDIKHYHKTTVLGVGDDAAIISPKSDTDILLSTDAMLEGIHFDLAYTPLEHLGYKAAVCGMMDIIAMGGEPEQQIISIAITSRFSVEDIEDIYRGIKLACHKYQVDLVGGDTSASVTGLTLNITTIGSVSKGQSILRSTAKPTDLICVTGDLGAAYMGLQLLERERSVFMGEKSEDINPDFAGKEYLIERQLKPEIPRSVLTGLRRNGICPTSMIDVSDGLASELLQIAKHSHVGIRIYEEKLPIDFQTASMAEEFNMNVSTVALNGGEDYELLMTIPLGLLDKAKEVEGLHIIGHVTEDSLGAALVTRDGNEITLKAQGFEKRQDDTI